MFSEQVHRFEDRDISVVACDDALWLRVSDVTAALGYSHAAQAVRYSVDAQHLRTLRELRNSRSEWSEPFDQNDGDFTQPNGRPALYIGDSGLQEFLIRSRKPEARRFREWIVSLSARTAAVQASLRNETDLHWKVAKFLRNHFPEAIVIAGLGEMQTTEERRILSWRKGYRKGQPDLLVLNRTSKNNGLAIELKTPTGQGVVSPQQQAFLDVLATQKYATLVSSCYDEIVATIMNYRAAALRCRPRPRSLV